MAILVAWTEMYRHHQISLRLENADGQALVSAQGDIEIGRPAGLPPGSDQRGVEDTLELPTSNRPAR